MLLPMICLCLCFLVHLLLVFLVEVYRFPSLSIIIYRGSISVCNVLSLSDVCTGETLVLMGHISLDFLC